VAIPYVARAGTGADSSTTRRRRNREFAKKTNPLIEETKKKTAERKRHLAPTVRSSSLLTCLPKRALTLSSTFLVVLQIENFVTVFGITAEKSPRSLYDRSLTHVLKGTPAMFVFGTA
jgi:hypothetical protein